MWVASLSAISGRPLMKFESGYTVETVFDGSKLGIEPFSVRVLPTGELLVLDSANSNMYKMSLPLSRCKACLVLLNFFFIIFAQLCCFCKFLDVGF